MGGPTVESLQTTAISLTYRIKRPARSEFEIENERTMLKYEVIWVHIDILAVAIRRLSRR